MFQSDMQMICRSHPNYIKRINEAQAEELNTDQSPTNAAMPEVPSYFFSGL